MSNNFCYKKITQLDSPKVPARLPQQKMKLISSPNYKVIVDGLIQFIVSQKFSKLVIIASEETGFLSKKPFAFKPGFLAVVKFLLFRFLFANFSVLFSNWPLTSKAAKSFIDN